MRFYFHVKDGNTILDEDGSEFPNVDAVKDNAVRASGEMLRGLNHGQDFWSGEPWKLWVQTAPRIQAKQSSIYRQASNKPGALPLADAAGLSLAAIFDPARAERPPDRRRRPSAGSGVIDRAISCYFFIPDSR
jgi:hypothetical protein